MPEDNIKTTEIDTGFRAGFILGILTAAANNSNIGLGAKVVLTFALTIAGGLVGSYVEYRREAKQEAEKHMASLSPDKRMTYSLMRRAVQLDKLYEKTKSPEVKSKLNLEINTLLAQVGEKIINIDGNLELFQEEIVDSKKKEKEWLTRILSLTLSDTFSAEEVVSEGEDEDVEPISNKLKGKHSTLFLGKKVHIPLQKKPVSQEKAVSLPHISKRRQ